MAAGLPVIASDIGGLPELLDDGRAGRLVAPSDAPAWARTLSDALSQCESSRERAKVALD